MSVSHPSPSPFRYLKAAFNARADIKGLGGVPFNWLALAGIAVLGLVNPGFLVLGAAAEIAILATLSQNARFRKVVDGKRMLALQAEGTERKEQMIAQLAQPARERYEQLVERTEKMIAEQTSSPLNNPVVSTGLARLHEIYLNLLHTREELLRNLSLSSDEELDTKLTEQHKKLANLADDAAAVLRRSAEETLRILERRVANRRAARERLDFVESELTRVEQQADLIVEEASLSRDPASLSQRIDAVTATYDDTLAMMKTYQAEEAQLELV